MSDPDPQQQPQYSFRTRPTRKRRFASDDEECDYWEGEVEEERNEEAPTRYRRWTRDELEKVKRLRQQGVSFAQIAKRLNRSEGSTRGRYYQSQREYGAAGLPRPWTHEELMQLITLRQSGLTFSQIGAQINRRPEVCSYQYGRQVAKLGGKSSSVSNIAQEGSILSRLGGRRDYDTSGEVDATAHGRGRSGSVRVKASSSSSARLFHGQDEEEDVDEEEEWEIEDDENMRAVSRLASGAGSAGPSLSRRDRVGSSRIDVPDRARRDARQPGRALSRQLQDARGSSSQLPDTESALRSAGLRGRTCSALGHFLGLTELPWDEVKQQMVTLRGLLALSSGSGNQEEVKVCDGLITHIEHELQQRGL